MRALFHLAKPKEENKQKHKKDEGKNVGGGGYVWCENKGENNPSINFITMLQKNNKNK